jgi:hypothetical protein
VGFFEKVEPTGGVRYGLLETMELDLAAALHCALALAHAKQRSGGADDPRLRCNALSA